MYGRRHPRNGYLKLLVCLSFQVEIPVGKVLPVTQVTQPWWQAFDGKCSCLRTLSSFELVRNLLRQSKRLDRLEIAYIKGSPLLFNKTVPFHFVRILFLTDSNYWFSSAVGSHLSALRSRSDLGKAYLWLVSSPHRRLNSVCWRYRHRFRFS